MTESPLSLAKSKVNLETAQIPWLELQVFFAKGLAIAVTADLDLVEVAYQFSIDNKAQVADWLQQQQVAPVSDQQAQLWFEQQYQVWAVVVKPWILVQPIESDHG